MSEIKMRVGVNNDESDIKRELYYGLTYENTAGEENKHRMIYIRDDKDLLASDKNYLRGNNDHYSALLEAYVNNAIKNNKQKVIFKWIFLILAVIVIVSTLGGIFWGLYIINKLTSSENSRLGITIANCITAVLTAIVPFITVMYVIPEIIAKYLFNTEDEKNMAEIVKSIQDYDKSLRRRIK